MRKRIISILELISSGLDYSNHSLLTALTFLMQRKHSCDLDLCGGPLSLLFIVDFVYSLPKDSSPAA